MWEALCLTYVYVFNFIWHSFYFRHLKNRLSWSSPLGNLYCDRFILLIFADFQRFGNGIIEGNLVWENNSGPALFKWRYTPRSTDDSGVAIRYFLTHSDGKINVIRRTDINSSVLQNSEIQGFALNGKVQSYLDSIDPTIFGFIISRVGKIDPTEYQCIASFKSQNVMDSTISQKLTLQVLGK